MKSQLLAASVTLAALMTPAATAQQAVQWKVSDGGNGHWYRIGSAIQRHVDAVAAAADVGAHLACLETQVEQNWLLSRGDFPSGNSGTWIGLIETADGWAWSNGVALGNNTWAEQQPCGPCDEPVGLLLRQSIWGTGLADSGLVSCCTPHPRVAFEWSADCNADGIVDYGQILDGTFTDFDTNGVPDVCECPSTIRVPQDQPSIDAAASFACPGLPLEIVVSEGTWPMSLALEGDYRITVRGVSRFNTIVTQDEDGVPINGDARAGASTTKLLLKNLTLANVRDSQNLQVGFESCDVRSCAATFLPGDMPVVDNLVEDCGPGGYPALIQSPLVMNAVTFNRCARPVLLVTDGARALVDCHFNDCSGTAVRIRGGDAPDAVNAGRLDRCTFSRNVGGAVVVDTDGPAGTPVLVATFIDCSFTDNAYSTFGSAVRLGTTQNVAPTVIRGRGEFVRCAFARNSAPTGGALYQAANHPARLESCTFTDNVATAADGGAIAQEFGGNLQALVVSGGAFRGNRAALQGGAIRCTGWEGKLEVVNATFDENEAEFQGGAIGVDRQSVAIADCAFTGNRAHEPTYEGGGAVYVFFSPDNGSANTIFRSQFSGNSTPGRGGAVALYFGVATDLNDCTFTGNQAGHLGGAVSINEQCSSVITASRMSSNTAPSGAAVHCMGTNYANQPVVRVEGCEFSANVGAGTVASTSSPAIELASNAFCASGPSPVIGQVSEIGPSCVTQFCTDSDGNGRADGCECSQNPGLPSCCLGDIFSDKVVNGGDLGVLLSQWGQSGVAGDLDGDGSVNGGDLGALLANWGPCQ